MTLVQGSSTNKSVILNDRYDKERHGLSVGWEAPSVLFYKKKLPLTVARLTDRFQSDASKLNQREVLMIKCIPVFSYSTQWKIKNIIL